MLHIFGLLKIPLNKPETKAWTQSSMYTSTTSFSLLLYIPEKKYVYLYIAGFLGKAN
jgi:hypothetical protein